MSARVAADLRAAAEVLRRDGWTRGLYTDEDGCHCVVGAIRAAKGQSNPLAEMDWPSVLPVWEALEDYLVESVGVTTHVMEWNDDVAQSADEVIAALEAAADAAEDES